MKRTANTHFTVKVVYTYKAFQCFSGHVFEYQLSLILFWKAHNGRGLCYSSLSLSLLFSRDTQPFYRDLSWSLHSVPSLCVLWKGHCSLRFEMPGSSWSKQTLFVELTSLFSLNLIMHGVAKPSVPAALLPKRTHTSQCTYTCSHRIIHRLNLLWTETHKHTSSHCLRMDLNTETYLGFCFKALVNKLQ